MKNDQPKAALLALEDGALFWGKSLGCLGEAFGELVFNTGMTGYQEVLTDPSYCGQIVVMTYPEIGIYGVNSDDVESDAIQVAGYAVHRAVRQPCNQRATRSFTDYLEGAGIVAIEGIDTRALTNHLRQHGAMRGAISCRDLDPTSLLARIQQIPPMEGCNLAQEVTVSQVQTHQPTASSSRETGPFHVVVVDAGTKAGIVRDLTWRGARVTIVPYDADVETVLANEPDGVLVGNGPGDPDPLCETIELMRQLLERRVPLAGICLGHQLLGLAIGGQRYKMRFGHRGVNHPVKDLTTGQVLITTHNHGFAVDPTSLGIAWEPLDTAFCPANLRICKSANEQITFHTTPNSSRDASRNTLTMAEMLPDGPLVGTSPLDFGSVEITHLSLNDGTVEGLRLYEAPAMSVQYHPEASPGPLDAKPFFDEFVALMEAHRA